MGRMIRYEWKKIWGSRLTQLSVLGCSLFMLFCTWANIRQAYAVDSEGTTHYGLAAKEILKQTQERQVLDQEAVEGIMQEYLDGAERIKKEAGDPEKASDMIWQTLYMPQGYLHGLITSVYREEADDETAVIYQKNMGRDFYQACSEKSKKYTALLEQRGELTPEEARYWNQRNNSTEEYTYGYRKGWEDVLLSVPWGILIMMIVCVGIAPVFAGEYQTKCDSLLLCMKYGKNKLAAAKVAAAVLYASAVYVGITILNSAVILAFLGLEGWDLPVQLYYPTVPVSYHVTFGQASLLMFLLGYVFTLGITAVTLWMSSIFKNAYGVIVAAFLLLIVPAFLQLGSLGYLPEHILSVLPSKIMDFSFIDYTAYSFFGKVFSCLSVDLFVNGAAAVLFSLAGYRMFQKHQVNR